MRAFGEAAEFVAPGTYRAKDDTHQRQGATPMHNFYLRIRGEF